MTVLGEEELTLSQVRESVEHAWTDATHLPDGPAARAVCGLLQATTEFLDQAISIAIAGPPKAPPVASLPAQPPPRPAPAPPAFITPEHHATCTGCGGKLFHTYVPLVFVGGVAKLRLECASCKLTSVFGVSIIGGTTQPTVTSEAR